MMPAPSFEPDFASPSEWASMYRAVGLQVVPARYPMRVKEDKRPALAEWREFQNARVGDSVFESWFGPDCTPNMGVITGLASERLLVIDIDDYKGGAGAEWWQSVTLGIEPETWCQTTGGGGRQYFFRLPEGVEISSHRTPIADIRCQGGFAMLPPSRHLSGRDYEWAKFRGPWEIEIDDAQPHMIEAVLQLIEEHRGMIGAKAGETTASPPADYDAFGNVIDGRETYMRDVVWAAVLNLYRRTKGEPPDEETAKEAYDAALEFYLRNTRTRLQGVENVAGLEREGRGPSLFMSKWRHEMRKWNGKVAVEAAKRPFEDAKYDHPARAAPVDYVTAPLPEGIFEFLDVKQIKAMPDPRWLVKGLVTEAGTGFIYGPPGSGKSFVAIGMGLSLATGMPDWWGRAVEREGAVIYISSEGQSDLKFRIAAWEQAHGVITDDAPFFLIRQSINFMQPDDIMKLLATVEAITQHHNVEPVAVFVDTVSRVLPGADENLQKDMTLFIAGCDAVRQRFACTVIGVHHTSRAGNLRGSSVFDGAGDFLASIEREEGATIGTLTAKKIKAAADGWKEAFRLDEIAVSPTHTSLVAMPT
jgi:hypothetical protein